MEANLISIIVPIFNKEDYLDKSITSLINQKYSNLEIILVNDGSTDNSLSICQKYKRHDKRIKVIDQDNGGVSSARNAGLEVATGDYIGFVDPDDWVSLDMYDSLYKKMIQQNATVAICNYWIEEQESKFKKEIDTRKEKVVGEEIFSFLIANMINSETLDIDSSSIMGSACRLLIKRDLIYINELKFDLDVPYMEDLLFVIEVLANASVVAIDKEAHYHYFSVTGSASRKYYPNLLENHMIVLKKIENILSKYEYLLFFEERLNLRYVFIVQHSIANEAKIDNHKSFREKIQTVSKILDDNLLKKNLENINYKDYGIGRKFILYSLENSKPIMAYFYYFLSTRIKDNKLVGKILKRTK